MTAKEKAKELESWYWHKLYQIQSGIIPTELAEQSKQCALICVDEILRILPFTDVKYWKEVKQELEKL